MKNFVLKIITRIFFFVVLLVALTLGVFHQSEYVRNNFMRYFLHSKAKKPPTKLYCDLFSKGVSGVVVEIGSGAGKMMNCWDNQIPITEYIGVDPNPLTYDLITRKILTGSYTFEFALISDISHVKSNSADIIISSLTLCSIDDLDYMYEHIDRVLKSGGQFIYYEHVKEKKFGLRMILQHLLYPVFRTVGSGCHLMKPTGSILKRLFFGSNNENRYEVLEENEGILDNMLYVTRSMIWGRIRKR